MLGDAYDSAELREELDERGTKPVIPNRSNRKQPYSFSKRLYKLRWRIESAFKAEGLPAHRNPLRQTGAKLPGFCLPRRSSCMVDLMSLGPSTTLALWAWQYLQVTCHSEDIVGVEVVRRGRGLLA